jgi:hypothetical protein
MVRGFLRWVFLLAGSGLGFVEKGRKIRGPEYKCTQMQEKIKPSLWISMAELREYQARTHLDFQHLL